MADKPDSEGPPRDATPAEEIEPFDPYRFQSLPVSPDLRQELIQAKLPRLEPEYFEDTFPPDQVGANPSPIQAPGARPSRSALAIGIAAVLAAVCVACLVHCMSGTETVPHSEVRR